VINPCAYYFLIDKYLILNFVTFQEGYIPEAENTKLRLEQAQRERRAELAEQCDHHQARWFTKTEDLDPGADQNQWIFKNTYWKSRQTPSFAKMDLPQLW
jgi:hypothetical protein